MSDGTSMSEEARKQLLERIEQLIERQHFEELRRLLSDSRSSDVAEVVEVVDEIARQILFDLLDPDDAGEVLEKIDDATRGEVFEDLSHKELTEIVATLPPDEAADVLADLPDEQTSKVLDQIPAEEAAEIEKLLTYDEESAGGLMNPELVCVRVEETVRDAIHNYRQSDPEEEFYYVFVVDKNGAYKGVVGLPDLLRHSRHTPIAEVMETDIPTVNIHADQEEIANIFRKNDLIIMPVVDEKGVLLGRITVDDIVDVMDEEADEDVLVMAGTHPSERETPNIFRAATIRLPWLIVCMSGSMITGITLISIFAPHFSAAEWVSIVMFMPALAAMGGNSGLQTSTVVVRGLATGDLVALNFAQVFLRESRVALVVAGICGTFAGFVAAAWLTIHPGNLGAAKAPILGLSVGMAMLCGIMLSTTIGFLLPFFFRRIGIDPAISSGPLVTTANDAVGCLTYFSLAMFLLKTFGG